VTIPPGKWLSLFKTVDRTEVAADLLDYSNVWQTPDGSERMSPLSMQQAQMAADNVMAFLNDRINEK
jgi:hypothetical protein